MSKYVDICRHDPNKRSQQGSQCESPDAEGVGGRLFFCWAQWEQSSNLENVQLEVSEKLPWGNLLVCSQLLCDWGWKEEKKGKEEKEISCGPKRNSSLEFCLNMVYRSFSSEKCSARGKVTTGITGLWQPSVHIDVALWSFDVCSSIL